MSSFWKLKVSCVLYILKEEQTSDEEFPGPGVEVVFVIRSGWERNYLKSGAWINHGISLLLSK